MNKFIETLMKLLDRLALWYFAKRLGKSEAINEAQEKILEDIKKRGEIESRNNNTDIDKLLGNAEES